LRNIGIGPKVAIDGLASIVSVLVLSLSV
jgi:hypothetical protein